MKLIEFEIGDKITKQLSDLLFVGLRYQLGQLYPELYQKTYLTLDRLLDDCLDTQIYNQLRTQLDEQLRNNFI